MKNFFPNKLLILLLNKNFSSLVNFTSFESKLSFTYFSNILNDFLAGLLEPLCLFLYFALTGKKFLNCL